MVLREKFCSTLGLYYINNIGMLYLLDNWWGWVEDFQNNTPRLFSNLDDIIKDNLLKLGYALEDI